MSNFNSPSPNRINRRRNFINSPLNNSSSNHHLNIEIPPFSPNLDQNLIRRLDFSNIIVDNEAERNEINNANNFFRQNLERVAENPVFNFRSNLFNRQNPNNINRRPRRNVLFYDSSSESTDVRTVNNDNNNDNDNNYNNINDEVENNLNEQEPYHEHNPGYQLPMEVQQEVPDFRWVIKVFEKDARKQKKLEKQVSSLQNDLNLIKNKIAEEKQKYSNLKIESRQRVIQQNQASKKKIDELKNKLKESQNNLKNEINTKNQLLEVVNSLNSVQEQNIVLKKETKESFSIECTNLLNPLKKVFEEDKFFDINYISDDEDANISKTSTLFSESAIYDKKITLSTSLPSPYEITMLNKKRAKENDFYNKYIQVNINSLDSEDE